MVLAWQGKPIAMRISSVLSNVAGMVGKGTKIATIERHARRMRPLSIVYCPSD
jgi:hypothetical protein